jgi:beta-xylosidase
MKKSIIFLFLLFFVYITVNGQQSAYTNPVIREDIADPCIVKIGNTYYASGTSSEWRSEEHTSELQSP